jgi:hypothetical protein
MYDKGKIFTGLALFALLFLSPLLVDMVTGGSILEPDLEPARQMAREMGTTGCIEDTAYMKANHMDMLNQWRNLVVREGFREYTSAKDGKTYEISLSNTCLKCHSNYQNFCNRCHTYNEVVPFCWDCHLTHTEEFK